MNYRSESLLLCLCLLIASSCASRGRVVVKWLPSDPSSRSFIAPNPNDDVPWEESRGYLCLSPQDAKLLTEACR